MTIIELRNLEHLEIIEITIKTCFRRKIHLKYSSAEVIIAVPFRSVTLYDPPESTQESPHSSRHVDHGS